MLNLEALASAIKEGSVEPNLVLPISNNDNHKLGVVEPSQGIPMKADKSELKVPAGITLTHGLMVKDNTVDGLKQGKIVNEKNPLVENGGEQVALRKMSDGVTTVIKPAYGSDIVINNQLIPIAGVPVKKE